MPPAVRAILNRVDTTEISSNYAVFLTHQLRATESPSEERGRQTYVEGGMEGGGES